MKSYIKDIIYGFFMGVANIIPGVSGGTFMLIFGIYERVIRFLNTINFSILRECLDLIVMVFKSRGDKDNKAKLFQFIHQYDFGFMTRLFIGVILAIIILSSIMKMLLIKQFSPTYAFFFGLIFISIYVPFKMLKKRSIIYLIPFIIGTVLTIFLSITVDPSVKTKKKSDIYKARYDVLKNDTINVANTHVKEKPFTYTNRYNSGDFLYAGLSGALAISAMILPGISGSLIMIMLGEYFEVISAISGLKTLQLDYFLFLGSLFIGMCIGLLLFSRIVNIIFKRMYNWTMSFLIGLMAGSLYTLWPFKSHIIIDQFVKEGHSIEVIPNSIIYTNKNILPTDLSGIIISAIALLLGGAIMAFFALKENAKDDT